MSVYDHVDPTILDAVDEEARWYESRKVEGKYGPAPNRKQSRDESKISPIVSQTPDWAPIDNDRWPWLDRIAEILKLEAV